MPIGIAGAIASGVGSLAQGVLGAGAAGDATKAAQQATAANLAYTKGIYNDTSKNLNPTIQSGISSGNALSGLLGTGGDPAASAKAWDQFRNSSNYNFQMNQGLQGVEYANAPNFNSGATGKALNNYAQGQAGSALQGYEALLGGQQQLGAQSALGLGSVGMQGAQLVSNANNFGANATGLGAIGGANSYGNALTGITSAINKGLTASSFGGGGGGSSLPADLVGLV